MSQREDPAGSRTPSGRRDLGRLVRDAAMVAYGVASVSGRHWYDRLRGRLGGSVPGVQVETDGGLRVEIRLALVEGVPARAVVSNVEESVRYIVQREVGLTIDELVIVVDGQPMNAPGGDSSPRRHG